MIIILLTHVWSDRPALPTANTPSPRAVHGASVHFVSQKCAETKRSIALRNTWRKETCGYWNWAKSGANAHVLTNVNIPKMCKTSAQWSELQQIVLSLVSQQSVIKDNHSELVFKQESTLTAQNTGGLSPIMWMKITHENTYISMTKAEHSDDEQINHFFSQHKHKLKPLSKNNKSRSYCRIASKCTIHFAALYIL